MRYKPFTVPTDGTKRIIIQKCKHGDRYFDASTQKAANAAVKKMFDNNCEMEFYGYLKERVTDLQAEIKKIEEAAKPLPAGLSAAHYKLTEEAQKKLTSKRRELVTAEAELFLFEKAKAGEIDAIKELLNQRNDY